MSTAVSTAPTDGGSAASAAPETPVAADSGQASTPASVAPGNAPGGGVDAAGVAGVAPAENAAAAAAALFRFNGRDWQSQKHAEDAIKAQIGRTPTIQRENADLKRQMAEMQQQIQTLRAFAGPGAAVGQGPGGPQGQGQAPAGPQSLLDEMAASGELQYLQELAQNPEIGVAGAVVTGLQALEKRVESRMESLFAEKVAPIAQQIYMQQGMAQFFGGARPILAQFPELAEDNQSPEAVEHQQAVLELLKTYPPEVLAGHPELVGMAAAWVRHQNGTPVFAQAPGTSGSPSARAAAAAELASAATNATPLDGSGVPRQSPRGPETPMDRIRREQLATRNQVKSESGRVLFNAD